MASKTSSKNEAASRENTDYEPRRTEPTVSGLPKEEEIRQAEVMPGETEPTNNADYTAYLEEQRTAGDENAVNGVRDQIVYPDRVVDAQRAGEWAAGKADSLYPPEDDKTK